MNLIKRWRGQDASDRGQQRGGERALASHAREDRPLARLRDEMDRVFDRVWKEFDRDPWSAMTRLPQTMGTLTNWPAMDMAEDDKALTIRLDVPGLDAKDVDVEVSGNQLSVRGQRRDEFTEDKKGLYRRERYSGSFARTMTLPAYVEGSKVEARYDRGTLTITVPKLPGQGPKRVQVKVQ